MSTKENPFARFEESYAAFLDVLVSKAMEQGDDETLAPLTFVEDAVEGAGADEYAPEWLTSYSSLAGQLTLQEIGDAIDTSNEGALQKFMTALIPAFAHAVRLGYTEGYFEGKSD